MFLFSSNEDSRTINGRGFESFAELPTRSVLKTLEHSSCSLRPSWLTHNSRNFNKSSLLCCRLKTHKFPLLSNLRRSSLMKAVMLSLSAVLTLELLTRAVLDCNMFSCFSTVEVSWVTLSSTLEIMAFKSPTLVNCFTKVFLSSQYLQIKCRSGIFLTSFRKF